MVDLNRADSRQSVDWRYVVVCLVGVLAFVVAPWFWYGSMWLGAGLGDRLGDVSSLYRTVLDVSVFMIILLVTWLLVMWQVRLRSRRGRRVDGGLALVILGAIELVATAGVLAYVLLS